jgi:hypothetical protein
VTIYRSRRIKMADVTGLVVGTTTVGANYNKFSNAQSDVGRELIISASKTNIVHADLAAVYAQLTLSGGDGTGTDINGPDAFTLSAVGTADGSDFVSGTTDVVFFKAQGTGTPNLTSVSGVTLAVVATFAPLK